MSTSLVYLLFLLQHRERIQQLLEEARESNPCLPTFEKLAKCDVHIDNYGFKHTHATEGLLLHYICQQLHMVYSSQLTVVEDNHKRWKDILTKAKMTFVRTVSLVNTLQGAPLVYKYLFSHNICPTFVLKCAVTCMCHSCKIMLYFTWYLYSDIYLLEHHWNAVHSRY